MDKKHDPFKTPKEIEHPLLYWVHKNLFSSLLNTALTLLSLIFLYLFVTKSVIPLFSWDWRVISANLKLILTGSYPATQLWRIWICASYVSLFFGFTFSINRKRPPAVMYLLLGTLLALSMLRFSASNRIWMLSTAVLLFLSFAAGTRLRNQPVTILVAGGWVMLLPIVFFIIRGTGGFLPIVKTNLWGGLLLSLLISLTSIFLSLPIGLVLALGRRSKQKVVRGICIFLIETIRGVPLITILFIGYLILPMALPRGWAPSVFIRALTGVVMFHSAYMAEALRGGLQGISRTQYEAATSLNLGPTKTMAFIILPQVLKRMIPVLVNAFTSALKDTSLISIIGMLDLIGISTSIVSNPKYLTGSAQVLFFEGAIYFVLCYSISKASVVLEKKLGVSSKISK